MGDREFDRLLAEAADVPFQGWDFSWLGDRYSTGPPPWDYRKIARSAVMEARVMLDMGTGGGESLSTVRPLPVVTVATEGYARNWNVAAERLLPLGVSVVAVGPCPDNNQWAGHGGSLPFRSESVDLVINRHEAYSPTEVARILAPGGVFITQQVGSRDQSELLDWFERSAPDRPDWNLEYATGQLEAAGLQVTDRDEAYPASTFTDVGALAYYLHAVPWCVPGFSIVDDVHHLARLHAGIQRTGNPLEVRSHRFWLTAHKPATPLGVRQARPETHGQTAAISDSGALQGSLAEAARMSRPTLAAISS